METPKEFITRKLIEDDSNCDEEGYYLHETYVIELFNEYLELYYGKEK